MAASTWFITEILVSKQDTHFRCGELIDRRIPLGRNLALTAANMRDR
jgi:hypothetical protein